MKTVPRSIRVLGLAAAAAAVMALALPQANAGDSRRGDPDFVPSGHAYGPGRTSLPHPESRQGQIESQADVRQMEIYESQRRQREFHELFESFQGTDLNAPGGGFRY